MLRTLVRKAPDSEEGQTKSTCHKNLHLTGRKVQIKSTQQHPFLGLALGFRRVGGVECYELSYVRHLTVSIGSK